MKGFEKGLVLALGGGGARGFAHVGVLQALEEMGIEVGAVVGVSAGAVAGAGYCLGYSPQQMRERVMAFSTSELARHPMLKALIDEDERDQSPEEDHEGLAQLRQLLGGAVLGAGDSGGWGLAQRLGRLLIQGRLIKSLVMGRSLMGPEYFLEVAGFFLPDVDMSELKLPFASVATDVCSGEVVALTTGSLRRAVAASCTIPGVGDPLEIDGRWLVDGGVGALVPTAVAKALGARRVVAVNVEQDVYCEKVPERAVEMFRRAGEIQGWQLTRLLLEKADLVITPPVGSLHWAEFSQAEWIMDRGREAALEMERELRRLGRRWWWIRRPW